MGHSELGGASAAFLQELLARAQNAFDVDGDALAPLGAALMHQTELRSCRQCNKPTGPLGYCTYRHVFLLPDGDSPVLWELEHNTGSEGAAVHELYATEDALSVAERRVHERIGGVPWEETEGEGPVWLPDHTGSAAWTARTQRAYVADDSADHGRRVLRRAENADRPGEDTRQLLATAFAHAITLAPKPRRRSSGPDATWCRFYEHAFLLLGGDEVVLWELEHNMTADGRLVCEVYQDEAAAELAADRHARTLGVEL